MPIKPIDIFLARFLDSFLYSSALMLILVLAAVSGYGAFFKEPVTAVLGIFLAILPLIFSAACLGAIILLVALKLSREVSIKTPSSCCRSYTPAELTFTSALTTRSAFSLK